MVTGSWLLLPLSMRTVYCTLPPGSLTLVGLADLLTVMLGVWLVKVTVASSLPLTGVLSLSVPDAVTRLVCVTPALPLMVLLKVQE